MTKRKPHGLALGMNYDIYSKLKTEKYKQVNTKLIDLVCRNNRGVGILAKFVKNKLTK